MTISAHEYGVTDRLVHRLALGNQWMRRLAFDMDCLTPSAPDAEQLSKDPLYVCGVARAGTTILLEALYSTRKFISLTYRNMPFVMAPRLWSRLSSRHQKAAVSKERAHRDRLNVGYDSPEAFEEVFWATITESSFIGKSELHFHTIDAEGLQDYRRYVGNIISAAGQPYRRYIAKNNNNVLRIGSIRSAFADAIIIVPFRNPVQQANSLLRQHRQFLKSHAQDAFALEYMNWLGHFEFGGNMKPFLTTPAIRPQSKSETLTLEYWIRYWGSVYGQLMTNHSDEVIFLNYDQLCKTPTETLERIADVAKLNFLELAPFAKRLHSPRHHDRELNELNMSVSVREIYEALCSTSL